MNLIEVILFMLMGTFPIILILLLFIGIRIIYSHWLKDLEYPETHIFRKGNIEYEEPLRLHSQTFNKLYQLSTMSNPYHQRQLVNIFSKLLNETLNHEANTKFSKSENLKSIIDNPNLWLDQKYDDISKLSGLKKKNTSAILYSHFIQLLEETQNLIQTRLVQK